MPLGPSWSKSGNYIKIQGQNPTSCFHFSAVHRFSLKPCEQPSLRFLFWSNYLISQSIFLRVFLLSRSHVFRSQSTDAPEAVTLLNTDGQDRTRVLSVRGHFLAVCDDTGRENRTKYNRGGSLVASHHRHSYLSSKAAC